MPDMTSTDLVTAYRYESGYRLLIDYMSRRVRDPFDVADERWAVVQASNARLRELLGSDDAGDSPLILTVELLVAIEDFLEYASIDPRYTLISQLEKRASAWARHLDQLVDEDD